VDMLREQVGTVVWLHDDMMRHENVIERVMEGVPIYGDMKRLLLVHVLEWMRMEVEEAGLGGKVLFHRVVPRLEPKRLLNCCLGVYGADDELEDGQGLSGVIPQLRLPFREAHSFSMMLELPLAMAGLKNPLPVIEVHEYRQPLLSGFVDVMDNLHYSRVFDGFRRSAEKDIQKRLGETGGEMIAIPRRLWTDDEIASDEDVVMSDRRSVAMRQWEQRHSREAFYQQAILRNVFSDALMTNDKIVRETYGLGLRVPIQCMRYAVPDGNPTAQGTWVLNTHSVTKPLKWMNGKGDSIPRAYLYDVSMDRVWRGVDHASLEVLQITASHVQSPVIPMFTSPAFARDAKSVDDLRRVKLNEYDMVSQYGMILMGGYDAVFEPDVFGSYAVFGAARNPTISRIRNADEPHDAIGLDRLVCSYVLDVGQVLVESHKMDMRLATRMFPKRFKPGSSWDCIFREGDRLVSCAQLIDLCMMCCKDRKITTTKMMEVYFRIVQVKILGLEFGKFNFADHLRVGLKRWYLYVKEQCGTDVHPFDRVDTPFGPEYRAMLSGLVQHMGRPAMYGVDAQGKLTRFHAQKHTVAEEDALRKGRGFIKELGTRLYHQECSIARVVLHLCDVLGDRVEVNADTRIPDLEVLDNFAGLDREFMSGQKIVKNLLRSHVGSLAYGTRQGVITESVTEFFERDEGEAPPLTARQGAARLTVAKLRQAGGNEYTNGVNSVTPYPFILHRPCLRNPRESLMSFVKVDAGSTRGDTSQQRFYVLSVSSVFMDKIIGEFDVVRARTDGFVVPRESHAEVEAFIRKLTWDERGFLDCIAASCGVDADDLAARAVGSFGLLPGMNCSFRSTELNFGDESDDAARRVGNDLVSASMARMGDLQFDEGGSEQLTMVNKRMTCIADAVQSSSNEWNEVRDSEILMQYLGNTWMVHKEWACELMSYTERTMMRYVSIKKPGLGKAFHELAWPLYAQGVNHVIVFYDGFQEFSQRCIWNLLVVNAGLQVVGEPGAGKSTRVRAMLTEQIAAMQSDTVEYVERVGDHNAETRVYPQIGIVGSMHSVVRPYREFATSSAVVVNTLNGLFAVGVNPRQAAMHPAVYLYRLVRHPMGRHLCQLKTLVIEEAETIDATAFEELLKVLQSWGVNVLMLGDPLQSPPVQGIGFDMDGPTAHLLCASKRYICDLQYRNIDPQVSSRLNVIAQSGDLNLYKTFYPDAFVRGLYPARDVNGSASVIALHAKIEQVVEQLCSVTHRTSLTFSVQNYKVMYLLWLEVTRRLCMKACWEPELRLIRSGGALDRRGHVKQTGLMTGDLADGTMEGAVLDSVTMEDDDADGNDDAPEEEEEEVVVEPNPVDRPIAGLSEYEELGQLKIRTSGTDISYSKTKTFIKSRLKNNSERQRGNGPSGTGMLTGCVLDFVPGVTMISTDRFRSMFVHPDACEREGDRVLSCRTTEEDRRAFGSLIQQQCQYVYQGFELFEVIMEFPYQPTKTQWTRVERKRGSNWTDAARANCPLHCRSVIRVLEFRAEWDDYLDPYGQRVWMTEMEASMFLLPSFLCLNTFTVGATLDELVILRVSDMSRQEQQQVGIKGAYECFEKEVDEASGVLKEYAPYSHIGRELRVAYTRVTDTSKCKMIQLDVRNYRLWLSFVNEDPMFGSVVLDRKPGVVGTLLDKIWAARLCHIVDFGMTPITARWQEERVQSCADNATQLTFDYVYMSNERDAITEGLRYWGVQGAQGLRNLSTGLKLMDTTVATPEMVSLDWGDKSEHRRGRTLSFPRLVLMQADRKRPRHTVRFEEEEEEN